MSAEIKLGYLRIVPVEPGNPNAPDEMSAVIDLRRGIAYVRAEDYPLICEELRQLTQRH